MKLNPDTAISEGGFCVRAYVHGCMWVNKGAYQFSARYLEVLKYCFLKRKQRNMFQIRKFGKGDDD